MEQVIGAANDGFAMLATPSAKGSYSVMIYPEISELAPEVEVSKARMSAFLIRHREEIQVERLAGSPDLFLSAVTEERVRELTESTRVWSGADIG